MDGYMYFQCDEKRLCRYMKHVRQQFGIDVPTLFPNRTFPIRTLAIEQTYVVFRKYFMTFFHFNECMLAHQRPQHSIEWKETARHRSA